MIGALLHDGAKLYHPLSSEEPVQATGQPLHAVQSLSTVSDLFTLLSIRGHETKVNCVCASQEVDFIISGGADFTMRIWRYRKDMQTYELYAVVQHSVNTICPVRESRRNFLVSVAVDRVKHNISYGHTSITDIREGITAVIAVGSRKDVYKLGDFVKVDVDRNFIQDEISYYSNSGDFKQVQWKEEIEAMVGEKYQIKELNQDLEIVGLATPSGELVYLPDSCVSRTKDLPPLAYRDGPFLCGSTEGTITVVCLYTDEARDEPLAPAKGAHVFKMHDGIINDLCVVTYGEEKLNFIVVSAGEDGYACMLALECEEYAATGDDDGNEQKYVLKLSGKPNVMNDDGVQTRMKHNLPVEKARALGHNDEGKVAFATLTKEGAHLWSITGTLMMVLKIEGFKSLFYNPLSASQKDAEKFILDTPHVDEYTSLAVANKDTGSLLFLSGRGMKDGLNRIDYVGVWYLDDGIVTGVDASRLEAREEQWQKSVTRWTSPPHIGIKPLTVYQQNGDSLDVDQSGETTTFAIDQRDAFVLTMWNLQSVDPDTLALEVPTPATLLVMPGHEKVKLEMLHNSKVNDFRVVEDPDNEQGAGGPALLVGCEDGSTIAWDIEGIDRGQQYVVMRSLGVFEILLPPTLLLVTAMQVLSFAFGPSIPWKEKIKRPTAFAKKIVFCDFAFTFIIDKELIFWWKTLCVVGCMLCFNIAAIMGVPQLINTAIRWVENTTRFKHEQGSGNWCSPYHGILRLFRVSQGASLLALQLCSTVLVSPMAKTIAEAVDCMHDTSDAHGPCAQYALMSMLKGRQVDSICSLTLYPKLICYEGNHLRLVVALLLVCPLYFFLLVPFAACAGDASYVPTTTLYDYKVWREGNMWRQAAVRAATTVNHGFLHPKPENALLSQIVDLGVKISLPMITIQTTEYPKLQMILVTAVGCISLISTLLYPPFLEHKFLACIVALRFFTVCVMMCGLVVVCLDNPDSMIPYAALVTISVGTLLYLVVVLASTPLTSRSLHLYVVHVGKQELGAA